VIKSTDEAFAAQLRKVLRDAKRYAVKWSSLSEDEKQGHVATQIRNFIAEVNGAYLEQRFYGVNYRLTAEEVQALNSIEQWHDYHLELAKWRRDPDNDAALQVSEYAPGEETPEVLRRLDTAPPRPAKPKAQPPRGCPRLPTIDEPRQWDDLVAEFFSNRRAEPGEQGE
jgi:hypothetical protein